jgi:hypothetical protein
MLTEPASSALAARATADAPLFALGARLAPLVSLLLIAAVACSPSDSADTTTSVPNSSSTSVGGSTTSTNAPTTSSSPTTSTTTEITPLELEITDPESGQIVDTDEYVFQGTITPGATITVGSFQATVQDGTWRIRLSLNQGSNVITFVASDGQDRELVRQVQVIYEVPDDGLPPGSP